MIEEITPIILTYNEAPNIGRTLKQLRWAKEIVVVDSFSNDETLTLLAGLSQVRVFQREFDCLANQFNFGLRETRITSEWVLALDSDYVLTDEMVQELRGIKPEPGVSGYRARFIYCVGGRPLRGSAYPALTVLFRRNRAAYYQDGHTHRLRVEGKIRELGSYILHDDQKSLDRWLEDQSYHSKLEAEKLAGPRVRELNWKDRLRRLKFIMPFAMLFYCLFWKGVIFGGIAGIYYTFQRLYAELLVSLRLIEHDLNYKDDDSSKPRRCPE